MKGVLFIQMFLENTDKTVENYVLLVNTDTVLICFHLFDNYYFKVSIDNLIGMYPDMCYFLFCTLSESYQLNYESKKF